MLADDIKQHMERIPFLPFGLRMADGREHPVVTVDHIYFPPNSRLLFVTDDDGITAALPTSYITGLIYREAPSSVENTPPES